MTEISEGISLIAGPSFDIDLSSIDKFHPIHYSRRLFFFRCPSNADFNKQLAFLKTGLGALLRRCPILGGTISPLSNQSCTIIQGPGIELLVKNLQTVLPSFSALEASNFPLLPYEDLVPVPKDLEHDQPFPALRIQFSAIDGGSILTFAASHSAADGSGVDELIRILTEETKAAQEDVTSVKIGLESSTIAIGLDRSVLSNLTSDVEFSINDHPAYKLNKPSPEEAIPEALHPFAAIALEAPILLRISSPNLARLKLDATPPGGQISTHDALSALIWRSCILIRSRRSPSPHATDLVTKFFMPSDARKQLGLPQNYVGNSVYQLFASLPLSVVLSSSGLQDCAGAVRKSIIAATPAVVRSFMAFYNNKVEDPTSIGWQFTAPFALKIGVAMGSSWKSSEVMYANWGEAFGDVIRYRVPANIGNLVLPRLPDGGAEVVVSVMPREMDTLKGAECFGKYL